MMVMLILYGLTSLGYMGPNPVGNTGTDINPLIVPEPYAFAIWSIIYLGLIVFPIYHFFRPPIAQHVHWSKVHLWYAINVVCNGLWLVCASYDWLILSVGVIVLMLISLMIIHAELRAISRVDGIRQYWVERAVFSVYFAWITLATVLNVASALLYYGWTGGPLSQEIWTVVMSLVAAAIAGHVAWHKSDRPYAAVVVWAFVALTIRHWGEIPMIAYTAIGVVVMFVGLIVGVSVKKG